MTTTVEITTIEGADQDSKTITLSPQAEAAVTRKFNPTGNDNVDTIKVTCATVIQVLMNLRDSHLFDKRNLDIAKQHIETAQMHAVKALFVEE